MKALILTFTALFFTFYASSQDCTVYFPLEEGSVLEMTNYNAKGKLQSVGTTTVKKVEKSGGDIKIDAELRTLVKKDESVIEYSAECVNGIFSLNMFGGMAANESGVDMEIDGDFLDIPSNPKAGQTLEDKTITLKMITEGTSSSLLNFKYNFTNRKVEAVESITTSAGTFDAVKLSYDMTFKIGIAITYSVVEWYSEGVGMVRSELYTGKGKLKSYSELTKLE